LFGVERDLKVLDPLLFVEWDDDRSRWVVRRKHRTWFHGPVGNDDWLSWFREDSVPILILDEGVKPGEWMLPKLYAMDSHRLPNKRSRIADAYREIEREDEHQEEKKFDRLRDDMNSLVRQENKGKAVGDALVPVPALPKGMVA
jgi:hypothetical protein